MPSGSPLIQTLGRKIETMSDEHFYSRVAEELRQRGPIPGLWAKAFVECNGDDARSKALYIKSRVEQLKRAHDAERKAEVAAQQALEQERIVSRRLEQAEAQTRLERDQKAANAALPFYKRTVSSDVASFIVVLGFMLLLLSIFFLFAN
jgi:leucyl aminopeptidase (aminopeptidase T)